MTKQKEAVASFGQIALTVEYQSAPKILQGSRAVIEVTSKEIYIGQGGNYKIKWKEVSHLDIDDNGFHLQATRHTVQATNPLNAKQQQQQQQQWKICRTVLERCWNKRMEKERKKEREAVELQQQQQRQRTASAAPRTYRKSYSKRKSRFDFLHKNENTNAWDSDNEGDDEVFNRQRPKRSRLGDLDHPSSHNDDEDKNEQQSAAEEEPEGDTINYDYDNDNYDDDIKTVEDNNTPVSSQLESDEVTPPSTEPRKENTSKTKGRRKLFKRKNEEEAHSDDDEIFNQSILTTPQRAKRIVSPATATSRRLHDDDDDDDDDDNHEVKEEHENTPTEEDQTNTLGIQNFFRPRKTISKPTSRTENTTESVPPPTKEDSKKRSANNPSKREPVRPMNDFFTIRKASTKEAEPADGAVESDESTVVPTLSSSQQTDIDSTQAEASIVSSPPKKTYSSSVSRQPAKGSIEEEDPIVDSPSNSSEKQPKYYSAPKRLFKNTYGKRTPPTTSTASMALDIADNLSPARPSLVQTMTQPLSSGAPAKLSRPDSPIIAPSKWRGLRNLGNSCYMNSSLQMLFSVPNFITAIQRSKEGRRLLSNIFRLWQDLQDLSKTGAATPKAIKSTVDDKTDRFQGYQQRDAHEFLGHLLDQMHDELQKPPEKLISVDANHEETIAEEKKDDSAIVEQKENPTAKLPTDSFFRLNVEVCLKCKSCGYSRTKEEMYRYLSIDIGQSNSDDVDDRPTVEKCLEQFFQPEERDIKCEKCEDGLIATQTMRVISRPKVLLLHLKRFEIVERDNLATNTNGEGNHVNGGFQMTFRKNKAPVGLTKRLSLREFLAEDKVQSACAYNLRSIVYHLGSTAYSGHYTADATRVDPDNNKTTWVSYDDGITRETSWDDIRDSSTNQKTAYMLLYHLE